MPVDDLIADATYPRVCGIPLAGQVVPVLHPSMWTPHAVAAVMAGDTRSWAAACCDDDGAAYEAADPTRAETAAFLEAVQAETGQPFDVIQSVLSLIDQYPAEVTADLARWYRTDVRDLWRRPGVSYRQVRAMLDHLPPESAVKTAIRDSMTSADMASLPDPDGWGPWSRTDELLALLVDRMAWLIYATSAAAGGKPSEPEPLRRPGVGLSGKERKYLDALTAAHVQYIRDHDGASPLPGHDFGISFDDF